MTRQQKDYFLDVEMAQWQTYPISRLEEMIDAVTASSILADDGQRHGISFNFE